MKTEKEPFTGVLRFANQRDLPERLSATASQDLRAELRLSHEATERWPGSFLLNYDKLKWTPDEPARERLRLTKILETIVSRDADSTRQIAGTLRDVLDRIEIRSRLEFRETPPPGHPPGRVHVRRRDAYPHFEVGYSAVLAPSTLAEWYGAAVAILLAHEMKVRRCAWRGSTRYPPPGDGCRRFYVAWKSPGPQRNYCSEDCAGRDRVAAHRAGMSVNKWRNRK